MQYVFPAVSGSAVSSSITVILIVVVPVVGLLIGLLIVVVVFVNCIDREAANHTNPPQRQTYYHRHKKVTNQRYNNIRLPGYLLD